MNKKSLKQAIKNLVGQMYRELHGAYGEADYEGSYDTEIEDIILALEEEEEVKVPVRSIEEHKCIGKILRKLAERGKKGEKHS